MWKISMTIRQKKDGSQKVVTSSYYPTEEEALAAKTQLQLLSNGWSAACRDAECERKNATVPTWKHHGYSITNPINVSSVK